MSSAEIVKFEAENGQEITVTEQDVRDLMAANGNAMEAVTSQEIKAFLRMCQSQRLNPFTRDAYIMKKGRKATFIAGKDAFTKRATRNKRYRGHEAGITFIGVDGKLHRRDGSMLMGGETLVGGWCKVYLEGYECPIYDEVSFAEYNKPIPSRNGGWDRMPATMIRKVALCHALREAFPEDLGGLYGEEEVGQGEQAYEVPDGAQRGSAEACAAVEDAPDPQPAAPPRQPGPFDAYRAALVRARDERGVPCADAMAAVELALGKPREEYDADDLAAAVVIVDGLGQPEPEYEVVEEQLPLSEDDIPF